VGFVYNEDGQKSLLRCLTIEEYRNEQEENRRNSSEAGAHSIVLRASNTAGVSSTTDIREENLE
jgi:hypothetical protein